MPSPQILGYQDLFSILGLDTPYASMILLILVAIAFLWAYNRRQDFGKPSFLGIVATSVISVIFAIIFAFVSGIMDNLAPWLTIPFVLSVFLVLPMVITGLGNAVTGAISGLCMTFAYFSWLYNANSVPEWFWLYFIVNPLLLAIVGRKLSDKSSFFFYFLLMIFIQILVGFLV